MLVTYFWLCNNDLKAVCMQDKVMQESENNTFFFVIYYVVALIIENYSGSLRCQRALKS